MTSKSLSYKTLVRRNLSRSLWVSALTLLSTISVLLLPLFAVRQDYQREMENYTQNVANGVSYHQTQEEILLRAQENIHSFLSFDNIAFKIIFVILAFLCGISMFRYLHDRQQVDFFHALPVNRGRLFVLNYVSGLLAVLPLFLIVYLISLGTAAAIGLNGLLTGGVILQSILGHISFFILNYTVAVLCTILTGNTIITVLLAIWVEFSVPLFMLMHQIWQEQYYMTYAGITSRELAVTLGGSPAVKYCISTSTAQDISYMVDGAVTAGGMGALLYPVIGTLIVLALSYVLFVRRKSECSGVALAFSKTAVPLRVYMCLFLGEAIALLFQGIFSGQEGWKWFGLILGIVLCHAVVEIIYEFDFKAMFHHWKQMIVLCVLAAGIMFGIQTDVLGFDSYVPKESDIAGVGLRSSSDERYYGYYTGVYDLGRYVMLTDSESIRRVHEIASCLVSNLHDGPVEHREDERYTGIWIQYELKNGKRIYRRYETGTAVLEGKLDELLTQETYLKAYMKLQYLNVPEDVKDGDLELAVYNSMLPERTFHDVSLTEKADEIRMIVESLKAEQIQNARVHMNEIPVLEMRVKDNREDGGRDLSPKTMSITSLDEIMIYPSDQKTIALIEERLKIAPAPLKAESVTEVQINLYGSISGDKMDVENGVPYTAESSEQQFIIQDEAQIRALIEDACVDDQVYYSGKYVEWDSLAKPYSMDITVRYQYLDGTKSDNYVHVNYPKGKTPIELLRKVTGKPLALQ